jgi:hypothetical protein
MPVLRRSTAPRSAYAGTLTERHRKSEAVTGRIVRVSRLLGVVESVRRQFSVDERRDDSDQEHDGGRISDIPCLVDGRRQ